MESIMKPPVPINFETYVHIQNGTFIRNIYDGKILNWISTLDLAPNGIDRNGNNSQFGRRSFGQFNSATEFNCFEDIESESFEYVVKRYGGFYISVEKFPPCDKKNAKHYAQKYMQTAVDAVSTLPSGEAFDCLFEHIYEEFYNYVLKHKKNEETLFAAWNRISKEQEDNFYVNGIYGIKGLIDGRNEHTSEEIPGGEYCVYRGESRMSLFTYTPETTINPEDAFWFLGRREFCENFYSYFGYRIMILPM